MVRFLLNFLLIFFMISSFSFARNDDSQYTKEFGPDLNKVPYVLRYAYEKKYNKSWKDTYFYERKAFIKDYEYNLTLQRAKEKAEAKEAAQKEKERMLADKEAIRKEKDRKKAQLAQEKAEEAATAARDKAFNADLHAQQQELQQMFQEIQQQIQKDARNR